ncbi:MAG TPA: GNAT family protein [Solirubrobacteraceae bacterium]
MTLRPVRPEDAERLRAIRAVPEVAAWWGPVEDDFPFGDDPDATRFSVVLDGEVIGLVQFGEEADPDYRHAWIDVFLDPAHHGRGLGAEAVGMLARQLIEERGHHRITIDPATENAVAIRCYEKAGFRTVGVMHAAWRDPWSGAWRDTLLMELVVPASPGTR